MRVKVKVKCKVVPISGHESPEKEQIDNYTLPSTSAQDGRWVVAMPRPFYPQGKTRYPLIGGWLDPRAGLKACGISRPPSGFDPRTVQPVASRSTDWVILEGGEVLIFTKISEVPRWQFSSFRNMKSYSHLWHVKKESVNVSTIITLTVTRLMRHSQALRFVKRQRTDWKLSPTAVWLVDSFTGRSSVC